MESPYSSTPSDAGGTPETFKYPHKNEDVELNKDLAALSYIYIMSVVIYLLRGKESAFIRFHSKQAMVLFLIAIITWFIPFIGPLLELVVLLGVAVGFVHAAQGQWKDVPIAGPLSRGEMGVRDAWKEIIRFVEGASEGVRAKKAAGNYHREHNPHTPERQEGTQE